MTMYKTTVVKHKGNLTITMKNMDRRCHNKPRRERVNNNKTT